jgi:hypothetical protein
MPALRGGAGAGGARFGSACVRGGERAGCPRSAEVPGWRGRVLVVHAFAAGSGQDARAPRRCWGLLRGDLARAAQCASGTSAGVLAAGDHEDAVDQHVLDALAVGDGVLWRGDVVKHVVVENHNIRVGAGT